MRKLLFLLAIVFLTQCKTDPSTTNNKIEKPKEELVLNPSPTFNEDSAYIYLKKQVEFGPRVPNTIAHNETKKWLVSFLKQYVDTVIEQNADLKAFDGTILKSTNIIASFNTQSTNRILLSAHWDTRPFADQDKERNKEPISGANDGASGVAVLLEIARQIKTKEIDKGIDIILFDAEDYGQPEFSSDPYMPNSYCLGSQHWAKNLHTPNYKAQFGILLDMVGAPNAIFTMEGTSMNFANEYLHKVWKIGHALGYSSYFSYKETSPITDDHLYINQIAKIPTIDIIHHDASTQSGFGWYWHTHNDNIDAIDKNTLKAVGQTVLQTIYQD